MNGPAPAANARVPDKAVRPDEAIDAGRTYEVKQWRSPTDSMGQIHEFNSLEAAGAKAAALGKSSFDSFDGNRWDWRPVWRQPGGDWTDGTMAADLPHARGLRAVHSESASDDRTYVVKGWRNPSHHEGATHRFNNLDEAGRMAIALGRVSFDSYDASGQSWQPVKHHTDGRWVVGSPPYIAQTQPMQRLAPKAVAPFIRSQRAVPDHGQAVDQRALVTHLSRPVAEYTGERGVIRPERPGPVEGFELRTRALAWGDEAITNPVARARFAAHVVRISHQISAGRADQRPLDSGTASISERGSPAVVRAQSLARRIER